MIKLTEEQLNIIKNSFSLPYYNEFEFDLEEMKSNIKKEIDEITALQLIEYVDTRFIEHGLVDDEPNKFGRDMEMIRDHIYYSLKDQ